MSGATSPEAETIIRQTETINRLMGQSADRIDRVQRTLDSAYAAQQRFAQAQNSINTAAERGRITQERANQLLDLARQKYQQTGVAAQAFAQANDNVARSGRNFGTIIGQAGFQIQDFAVQVASGQSALTAFVQQGSQLAGVFGPAGAIAGAVLAIGGVAAALLGAGADGAAAAKRIEDGFRASQRATEDLRRVVQGLSGELLTAAERAAQLANNQRQVLVSEGMSQMMRLENERTAAGEQQSTAQRDLDRAARDEARFRSLGPGFDSELREVQGRRFSAQAQLDAARSTQDEVTRRINELRGLTDRVGMIRTGPEEYGPNAPSAPERRSGGGGGGASAQSARDRLLAESAAFTARVDPLARYQAELSRIGELQDRLQRAGLPPIPDSAVVEATNAALDRYNQQLEQSARATDRVAESTRALDGLAKGVGGAFASAFEELVFEGARAEDVLKKMERQLLRLGNQHFLQPLFQQGAGYLFGTGQQGGSGMGGGGVGGFIGSLLGGAAKGAFGGSDAMLMPGGMGKGGFDGGMNFTAEAGGGMGGGGVAGLIGQGVGAILSAFLHEGGVAGVDGRMRRMPAEVFLDVPRYHKGGMAGAMPFASDEVPAVLRRGEMVLTERQQAAVASRGSINQTVIVKAEDPGAFHRTRGQVAREMRRELGRASRSV